MMATRNSTPVPVTTPDPVAAVQELFRGLRAIATVLRRVHPGRDVDVAYDCCEDAIRRAAKSLVVGE